MKKILALFLPLLLVFSALHFCTMTRDVRKAGFIDTPTFIWQAGYFKLTGMLYSHPLKSGGMLEGREPAAPWYKFPPAYMLAYMPWVEPLRLDADYDAQILQQAAVIWGLHVLRYLISVILLLLLLGAGLPRSFIWLGASMSLLFTPMLESLQGLIFDNLLFFCLVLILGLHRMRRDEWSGWIIGLVGMLKLYPALLLLWVPALRCWPALWRAAAAAALLFLTGILVFGRDNTEFYYMQLLPLLLREASLPESFNLSMGYFFRQGFEDVDMAMAGFGVAKNLALLATAAGVLIHGGAAASMGVRGAAAVLSAITCLLLLYLPNYWGNYQLILLLPVLTLLANAFAGGPLRVLQGVVACGCWFVLVFSPDTGGHYVPFLLGKHRELLGIMVSLRPFCTPVLWLTVLLVLCVGRWRQLPA